MEYIVWSISSVIIFVSNTSRLVINLNSFIHLLLHVVGTLSDYPFWAEQPRPRGWQEACR
jgi:hypothetical protein